MGEQPPRWKFLDTSIPATEPPLPDDFGVGSDIVVMSRSCRHNPFKASVVKKGRVWVTAVREGYSSHEYRFRLDDQTNGSDCGLPMFFRTPEQHRYFEALADASKYFLTIGLRTEGYGYSPVKRANLIELGRLIYKSGLVPDPGKS